MKILAIGDVVSERGVAFLEKRLRAIKKSEGIDFTVEGNQITFLQSGNIRLKEYTYIHPQSNPYGYDWGTYYNRTAAGDGKWEYWGQSPEFYNGYINVTYTHSDSWSGYTPEKRADQVPLTSSTVSGRMA